MWLVAVSGWDGVGAPSLVVCRPRLRRIKYTTHAVTRTANGIPSPSPTFSPIESSEFDVAGGVPDVAGAVSDVAGDVAGDVPVEDVMDTAGSVGLFVEDDDDTVLVLLLVAAELVVLVDGVWVNLTREPLTGG